MMINGIGNYSNFVNGYFLDQKYGVKSDDNSNENNNNPFFADNNKVENGNSQNYDINFNAENKQEKPFKTNKEEGKGEDGLTKKERKEVKRLKEIDRKIKQHEQAHLMAGVGLTISGAQFEYERGPDGQLYAVAGEVRIDTSEVPNDPEATLEKAKKIQRAALAPQDPSPQDRQVAAKARQMENKARMEIMEKKQKKMKEMIEKSKKDEQKNDINPQNHKITRNFSDPNINMINSYNNIQSPVSSSINIMV